MVGPPASTSATPASAMLSKNSQQKIKAWAGYTKHGLDELIPKDKRSLRERLTEVVSASLKEGNLKFELMFLPNLCWPQSAFPLNDKALSQKLEQASTSSEVMRLRDVLVPLWEAVLAKSPNARAIYDAFSALLDKLDTFSAPQPSTPGAETPVKTNRADQSLRTHWESPYLGSACHRLRSAIQKYQETSSPDYYSKAIYLMQSSGAGKSRLANEYGNITPMVTFVIREPTQSGFPPSDDPVYSFLQSHPNSMAQKQLENSPRAKESTTETIADRAHYIWYHALAIGILRATFERCSEKITEWNSAISTSAGLASKFQRFLGNVNNPSQRRVFYKKIVASARDIAFSCVAEPSFRQIFDDQDQSIRKKLGDSSCDSMRQLRTAFNDLQDAVKPWRQAFENQHDPLFTLVFDEVGSLMKGAEHGRFISLNRMISVLSKGNVWFLFLSTESRLDKLLPPDRTIKRAPGPNEQSSRSEGPVRRLPLKRYPPFTSFAVDVDDLKNHYQANPAEETMSSFSKLTHLGRFSRPLWLAYDRPERIAGLKLIGGRKDDQYDPKDRDHVFATLSFRLCLDVDLMSPIAYPLSQSAVHSHMRIVTKVIPSTGLLHTRTPTEPILALAAKEHLVSVWKPTLQTFTSELLSLGVIDKGRKGELFARLLCILARDSIPDPQPLSQDDGAVPTFTVSSFLQALFAGTYHGAIEAIDSTILRSRLNFLMFTSTIRDLTNDSFYHLCHALLRRSVALQCAPGQRSYDLVVPFYWGHPDEPYDLAKAGAILVQVKNRATKTSPQELLHETFLAAASATGEKTSTKSHTRTGSGILPNSRSKAGNDTIIFDRGNPKLLYLLLDLGVPGPELEVQVSKHENPKIWAIHCVGHNKEVFGCIQRLGVELPAESFFSDIMEAAADEYDIDTRHDADLVENVLNCDWEDMKEKERAAALEERAKEIEAESSREPEPKLKKRKRGN